MSTTRNFRGNGSLRLSLDFSATRSLTKQSPRDDLDVNRLVKRYGSVENLASFANLSPVKPSFGDFTSPIDYAQSLEIIGKVDDAFSSLPSDIRFRFSNDPAELLDFLENPQNKAEAVRLGFFGEEGSGASAPVAQPSLDVIVPGDSSAGTHEQKQ